MSNEPKLYLTPETQKVKELLEKGELKNALDHFQRYIQPFIDPENPDSIYADKQLSANFTILSAQISKYLSETNRMIITQEYTDIQFNKLLISFIELLRGVNSKVEVREQDVSPERLSQIGFAKIDDSNTAFELIVKLIETARTIKVIGMGRQYIAEHNQDHIIQKYYAAIENRISEATGNTKISIKRITQHLLEDKFKNHLGRCFNLLDSRNNKNTYEIVLYGDLKITYTYIIISQPTISSNFGSIPKANLFLTLNGKEDIFDTMLVFHTTNNIIIEKFTSHFNAFWNDESQRGRVLRNASDFEKYIPFDKDLYSHYSNIKHIIKRIPNDSMRMKYLVKETEIFSKHLKSLDECCLQLEHSNKNQAMSSMLNFYMDELRVNPTSIYYKAYSLKRFWESLSDPLGFLSRQGMSLRSGAKVERIYCVDSSELNKRASYDGKSVSDIEIDEIEKNVIHKNLEMWDLPHQNFYFRILFSEKGELDNPANYSIWYDDDKKYRVLFDIRYGTLSVPGVTEVRFLNLARAEVAPETGSKQPSIEQTKMLENKKVISDKEKLFEDAKKRVTTQNMALINLVKQKTSDPGYIDVNPTLELELMFLKKFFTREDELLDFLLDKR